MCTANYESCLGPPKVLTIRQVVAIDCLRNVRLQTHLKNQTMNAIYKEYILD